LRDKKVDFLFIDADHSYEGIKNDFEMYSLWLEKAEYSFSWYRSFWLSYSL